MMEKCCSPLPNAYEIERKKKKTCVHALQSRVMLLPERVLVVRVPVVARLRELAGRRVLDLIG
jgi:hypothetical protein